MIFNLLAAASVAIALVAGAAWLLSYVRPLDWHALDVEHHPRWIMGLTPDGTPGGVVARKPSFDANLPEGYWRAWWISSAAGLLTLLHQDARLGNQGGVATGPPTMMFLLGHVEIGRQAHAHTGADVVLYSVIDGPPRTPIEKLGFSYRRNDGAPLSGRSRPPAPLSATARALTLPYWALVLLGLPLPTLWLRRRRAVAARAKQGLCAGCGYDLRGSPGRCPECGREKPLAGNLQP